MARVQPEKGHAVRPARGAKARPKSSPTVRDVQATRRHYVNLGVGLLYVAGTLVLNSFYLGLLSPYIANDLWWPQFNSTGIQTFLADLINARLACQQEGPIDLFADDAFVQKDYSTPDTKVDFRFPSVRRALFGNFSFPSVVAAMRNNTVAYQLQMLQPYCWVDFDRRFQLAHTLARQERCNKWYANAGMYVEPLLRNAMPNDVSTVHIESQSLDVPWQHMINDTIFNAMRLTQEGALWVRLMEQFIPVVSSDEVAYWLSKGTTYWNTQTRMNNIRLFTDTIDIMNALGVHQDMTINKVPAANIEVVESLPAFDQIVLPGLLNDMMFCYVDASHCTVLRNTSFSVPQIGKDWDIHVYATVATSAALLRSHVGPLSSLDIRMVGIPTGLSQFYLAFQGMLSHAVVNDATRYEATSDAASLDPIPLVWANLTQFYSGSPLCLLQNTRQPFPLAPFLWQQDCTASLPFKVIVRRNGLLFATTAAIGLSKDKILDSCSLCASTEFVCYEMLQDTLALHANHFHTINATLANAAVALLDISLFQLGQINGTDVFMKQSLIQTDDYDAWTVFGWSMVYDWLEGYREVYAFEGDNASLMLMSDYQRILTLDANPLELPRNACDYLWYLHLYITCVLVSIGSFMGLYAMVVSRDIEGYNLTKFNRVVGSVWIGRPLLVVRGMTAIVILSTSSVQFSVQKGISRLVKSPRSFFDTAIIAGESTWLTYAFQDFCLPFTGKYSAIYAPLSSALVWAVRVLIETAMPYEIEATIDRTCTAVKLGYISQCANGHVDFGSYKRFAYIILTQAIIMVVCYVIARVWWQKFPHDYIAEHANQHIMIPSAAQSFYVQTNSTHLDLDTVSCVMCGILPWRNYLFDIKSWVFVRNATSHRTRCSFATAEFMFKPSMSSQPSTSEAEKPNTLRRWFSLYVFGYIGMSLGGSYLFLAQAKSIMANDFWWDMFNATGHQTFVANYFGHYLLIGNSLQQLQLSAPGYNSAQAYNTSSTAIERTFMYTSSLQNEANSVPNVVQGLRNMDEILLPLIFTPYCFVDFSRRWTMAYSTARQQRCDQELNNGAVYLESFLRNTNWDAMMTTSYGRGLDIGVFSYLRESVGGIEWIQTVRSNQNSIIDEIHFWYGYNISTYKTQWQNYKQFGLMEKILIQNALGVAYPFTIKDTKASSSPATPTSNVMYWSLSNDLIAVGTNWSNIQGLHLIRESPKFAFANTTLGHILGENAVLSSPYSIGRALVESFLGPFGTVDMKRVPCPLSLRQLYRHITEAILTLVNYNSSIQASYIALPNPYGGLVRPYSFYPNQWADAWNNNLFLGGDILCDSFDVEFSSPGAPFSTIGGCNGYSFWYPSPPIYTLSAILASGFLQSTVSVADVCNLDTFDYDACASKIQGGQEFLIAFMANSTVDAIRALAVAVEVEVRDDVGLSLVQFIKSSIDYTTVSMSIVNIFDPVELDMAFFSWELLIEWVECHREVVSFQGDTNRTLTTPSKFMWNPSGIVANDGEIPRNFSLYTYRLSQYITGLLFLVACGICLCILLRRGWIEGWNMFVFNRVAGSIWIGRPLLFVRGLIALCLLSTATLNLANPFDGPYFQMLPKTPNVLRTILSSNEVNWIVYLTNDILSVFTQERESSTAVKRTTVLTWIVATVISFIAPVGHSAWISRQCHLDAVDFHMTCVSATLAIGQVSRLYCLIALTIGTSLLCYVVDWLWHPTRPPPVKSKSLFLCAAAKFRFDQGPWMYNGVYYLDMASALLNGMISIEYHEVLYVFDIKTWRLYVMDIVEDRKHLAQRPELRHLMHAIPLVE
ncbi:Aste57867_18792 [Aphanomyces stellatus]|uniref:Aste57867_18792 protein n=1 Tax=Aphanomyces stellatus TaxID=120398 RepID=A0A485LBW3_9STRA|nr:hypothetical protein As57867_018728 [Aphanomyces stellatus]VFT95526.1 Aste57867_18792 [Aphanomyces stellatus]